METHGHGRSQPRVLPPVREFTVALHAPFQQDQVLITTENAWPDRAEKHAAALRAVQGWEVGLVGLPSHSAQYSTSVADSEVGDHYGLFCLMAGRGGRSATRYIAQRVETTLRPLLPSGPPPHPSHRQAYKEWREEIQQALAVAMAVLHRAFAAEGRVGTADLILVIQCDWLLTVASLGGAQAVLDTGREVLQLNGDSVAGRGIGGFEGSAGPPAAPLPLITQVVVPHTGGRLLMASGGAWSAQQHTARTAAVRTWSNTACPQAILDLASKEGRLRADASVAVVDLLPPTRKSFAQVAGICPTWQRRLLFRRQASERKIAAAQVLTRTDLAVVAGLAGGMLVDGPKWYSERLHRALLESMDEAAVTWNTVAANIKAQRSKPSPAAKPAPATPAKLAGRRGSLRKSASCQPNQVLAPALPALLVQRELTPCASAPMPLRKSRSLVRSASATFAAALAGTFSAAAAAAAAKPAQVEKALPAFPTPSCQLPSARPRSNPAPHAASPNPFAAAAATASPCPAFTRQRSGNSKSRKADRLSKSVSVPVGGGDSFKKLVQAQHAAEQQAEAPIDPKAYWQDEGAQKVLRASMRAASGGWNRSTSLPTRHRSPFDLTPAQRAECLAAEVHKKSVHRWMDSVAAVVKPAPSSPPAPEMSPRYQRWDSASEIPLHSGEGPLSKDPEIFRSAFAKKAPGHLPSPLLDSAFPSSASEPSSESESASEPSSSGTSFGSPVPSLMLPIGEDGELISVAIMPGSAILANPYADAASRPETAAPAELNANLTGAANPSSSPAAEDIPSLKSCSGRSTRSASASAIQAGVLSLDGCNKPDPSANGRLKPVRENSGTRPLASTRSISLSAIDFANMLEFAVTLTPREGGLCITRLPSPKGFAAAAEAAPEVLASC